jgi:peptidoglycan/xylan/chitin deacetylase (PgdA/CDA1 family)
VNRVLGAVATVGLSAATVNALPSLTGNRALRCRLAPALSGYAHTTTVALTFDDGPDPTSTPAILDALVDAGVHATFFLLGSMLERAEDMGRELVDAGHEIAVHGWSHRYLLTRGPLATYRDIARAYEFIAETTGVRPTRYRPPYGALTTAALAAARRLQLTPVLWTACGNDWTPTATPESVTCQVTRQLRPGGTILLHDSDHPSAPGRWRSTLGALPRILAHCTERGLTVGSLAERARALSEGP